ncbi:unnamed protein product, partial [Polarella glacialis]
VLVVRGALPLLISMPLGGGGRWLLVATEALPERLGPRELQFLVGRQIGQVMLHHGNVFETWPLRRWLGDGLVLPRYAVSRMFRKRGDKKREEDEARNTSPVTTPWSKNRRKLKMLADTTAELCDMYRGLRTGRWPGL